MEYNLVQKDVWPTTVKGENSEDKWTPSLNFLIQNVLSFTILQEKKMFGNTFKIENSVLQKHIYIWSKTTFKK